jgi:23S rRNA (uridine2552-2'-O)-methyltransferase
MRVIDVGAAPGGWS